MISADFKQTIFFAACIAGIEFIDFNRRKHLFTDFSMVFLDTTYLFFHGEDGEVIGEPGYSKDNRPDLKQMIAGVVLDKDGVPVSSMMLSGNINDTTTFIPFVRRLRDQLDDRRRY